MQLPRDKAQMNAEGLLSGHLAIRACPHPSRELKHKQFKIDKLTHEMAVLKRLQFSKRSERDNPARPTVLEETIDACFEAIEVEFEAFQAAFRAAEDYTATYGAAAHLPRREAPHKSDSIVRSCRRQLVGVGDHISEWLDYTPGCFKAERHFRNKPMCRRSRYSKRRVFAYRSVHVQTPANFDT